MISEGCGCSSQKSGVNMKYNSEITLSRVYDYQKVDVKLISEAPMELEEINKFRQEAAKLGDEALRELKITQNIEKDRDKYFRMLADLEEDIAFFPVIEEGEDFGKIDTPKLNDNQKKTLSKYKKIREMLSITKPYDYRDNQTYGLMRVNVED